MSSSDDDVPLARGKLNGALSSSTNVNSIVKPTTNGDVSGKRKQLVSRPSYKEQNSSGDEDDLPLSKRRKTSSAAKPSAKSSAKPANKRPTSDSDSDVPLKKKTLASKPKVEPKQAKTPKANGHASNPNSSKKRSSKKEADSDDNIPLSKKAIKPSTPAKKKASQNLAKQSPSTKKKAVKEEEADEDAEIEAEEEEYRWWEDPTKGDGTIKWTTLEHNGVVFPPDYEPLPKSVKMEYDGVPVTLDPEAEEIAVFYGSMLHSSVNVENPTFNKNFFHDFKEVLDKTGHGKDRRGNIIKIKEFEKCNFRPIFEHFEAERAAKKALPAAEKKELKRKKDEAEAPYMYCMWDGRKQKVGNFRVEPPSLFRGRGEHPKTGHVKKRVQPEQITINIGKEATVPAPPRGHRWKEVKHDQEGTWLAMWQENINGNYKYVMLAANSDIKGQSDYKKFEKARELEKHIERIRKDYKKDLKSEAMADRQLATAVYLIDVFALRAGNEKGDDEADTVGCCSLKLQHITLKPPKTVIFDFLGKDSIRFFQEVEVDEQVFKNLRIFKKAPKGDDDDIFDRVTTSSLNKHLSNYMQGLTAKVFRTYNASRTMSDLLQKMKSTGTVAEKVKDYNDANREVAIICNHKRTVAAGHDNQMEKLTEKINGLRYEQWRLKQMMIDLDPKLKKKKGPDFFALPEDLTEEWVKTHQESLVNEQREKIQKKFDKDNEKRANDGDPKLTGKDLDERLEAATELEQKYKKENKTKKIEAEKRYSTIDKIENAIEKLSTRIQNMRLQAEDKEENKEVALGTSKINYIDPRLTVVFSKKFNVPIEKFFSKTLREKFDWAIKSVDENWEF